MGDSFDPFDPSATAAGATQPVGVDPIIMQTTINQLVGVVTGLQEEVQRLQAAQATPPTAGTAHIPGNMVSMDREDSKLKIAMPKSYDGSQQTGAAENFLFDCEHYFMAKQIQSDKRVYFASALLEGPAKTWWRFLCHRKGDEIDTLLVWGTFRAQLLDRFRAVNATRHARDQLAGLRQESSVRIYAQKIQELAVQIPTMQDEELLDRFVRGLKTRTRQEVIMREPATFEDAVKLADKFDSLFSPGLGGFGPGFGRQPMGKVSVARPDIPILSRPNPSSGPVPMEIDALRRRNAPLTPEERTRLMKIRGMLLLQAEWSHCH